MDSLSMNNSPIPTDTLVMEKSLAAREAQTVSALLDADRNCRNAYLEVMSAACIHPNDYPVQLHKRAIDAGVKPSGDAFRVMQAYSAGIMDREAEA